MKIYTRTGDDGSTGLFGGNRVSKGNLRISCYGTVDELNSLLGLVRSHLPNDSDDVDSLLHTLQSELFVVGSDLATPHGATVDVARVAQHHIVALERQIDRLEADLPLLKNFILPGGTVAASCLNVARGVCRRAERLAVDLAACEQIGDHVLPYLNRLSDLLFVLARTVNRQSGTREATWSGGGS